MIRVLRLASPALLLIVLALAPFLDKAYTMDDTLFLRVAEHALQQPLAPTAFTYTWSAHPERMGALLANGPLGGYLLVPTLLAGSAEWVAHVTWWALLAVAVLATVSLAQRIGLPAVHAGFAGLLVVAAPAVLIMASTNMPDVPALALAALGMERIFAWNRERRWHQAIAAALALGLVPLARSQTILLWPLAGLVSFLGAAERRDWKVFAPRTLIPVIAMPPILWTAIRLTADPEHAGSFVDVMRRFFFWDRMANNATAWALGYALAMPLVLWLVLRLGAARWWWAGVFVAATKLALPQLVIYGPRRFYLAPLAGITAMALVDMTADAWRRRDLLRCILIGWTLISLPIVTYLQMSAKYLVPSAPAVALLVVLAAQNVSRSWGRAVMSAGAAAGLAIGVVLVQAESRYGDLGRRAAAELIAPRVAQGQRVWFAGHWGFQWYAEHAGARVISRDPPQPEPGDAIVSGNNMHGFRLVRMFPSRRLVTSLAERRTGGRLMSSGAGFWSNAWGFLPWAWGSDEVERFDLWELPVESETGPTQ